MGQDNLWKIIVLFLLLAFSAFFSAAETALMSLSKIRTRNMMEEGVKGAVLINKLVQHPAKLLGTVLLGNNAVNIAASALATSLAIEYFRDSGIAIATAVMTIIVLIFCEITPKSLAAQNSEKVALKVIKLLSFIVTILNPVVVVFTYLTNGLVKLMGGNIQKKHPFITEEELRTIVNVSQEEGVLEVEEREMIHNVFEFGDLQVKDVMVQRTETVAIDVDYSYEQVINIIKSEQFSRYPVYRDKIDDIIGILNVKDIAFNDEAKENFRLENFIREPYYTFEFKKITEVFKDMKKKRVHISIVLDEYGGTAGIVTIEDLIEEIVGNIEDEYDDNIKDIEVIKEDEFIINASLRIETVNEMIGTNFESQDVDSIGGFIIKELGRLPELGEKLELENTKIIVERVDKNRIKCIRILTIL
ncbi:HlyC/CorC family transporter [Serpentinicella alkaliphila]|uniref:Putative hemolysin n=1 Tax=Serpentinicella alkaliphila TaxID=1734049 RepID=A0A4R2TER5_9FIRM|nr:hemolysin family protein [Serpentinicella alkaliphila]QUH24896.1 HlyC/CorC family transporter [Serpentinicella alkaliphila]TCQ01828.1 putative hemolysin [Serpentinicella alkaliphila]